MINSDKITELKTELLCVSMNIDNDDRRTRAQVRVHKMKEARHCIEIYREQQALRHQTEEFLFEEAW